VILCSPNLSLPPRGGKIPHREEVIPMVYNKPELKLLGSSASLVSSQPPQKGGSNQEGSGDTFTDGAYEVDE
jgi:hypothetical protein